LYPLPKAMTIIRQDDLIDSVADALQFISYYHPKDFVDAMYQAYQREESQAAKDAMAQILINSRMCAEGRRPRHRHCRRVCKSWDGCYVGCQDVGDRYD
jgi:hypothetical protein